MIASKFRLPKVRKAATFLASVALVVFLTTPAYVLASSKFMQLADLTASDGQLSTDPDLGSSLAISGNTVVVGAPGAQVNGHTNQGAIYVFIKPASGWTNMTQVAKLTASDGGVLSALGGSVAISGDTIVAGAPSSTIGQDIYQGAVYVFVRPMGGWTNMTQTAKLTSSDGRARDGFGQSVSISGDTIAVGAPQQPYKSGKAYVFVKPSGGWTNMTQTAELTPSDPSADSLFGGSVQLDSSTLVVGAAYRSLAYVFVKPSTGWADMHQNAELTPSDGAAFDLFGLSVAIHGTTIVVGSPSSTSSGAAYLFAEPPGGWVDMTQTAEITNSEGSADDYFGSSVSTNGTDIVVGADNETIGSNFQQGAAYLFVKPGTGWKNTSTFNAKWTAADGAGGYAFGFSVAASGTTAVIGGPFTNLGTDTTKPGAAYVFGQ